MLTTERMQKIMLEVDLGKENTKLDTPEESEFRARIKKNMENVRALGRPVTMHFTPEFPDLD